MFSGCLGTTPEGICYPHGPVVNTTVFENRAHVYSCASTPHTRFNKVARYSVLQNLFDAEPNISEAFSSDHGQSVRRQCAALFVEGARIDKTSPHRCGDAADTDAQEDFRDRA